MITWKGGITTIVWFFPFSQRYMDANNWLFHCQYIPVNIIDSIHYYRKNNRILLAFVNVNSPFINQILGVFS
jgi:hypothetical protein